MRLVAWVDAFRAVTDEEITVVGQSRFIGTDNVSTAPSIAYADNLVTVRSLREALERY